MFLPASNNESNFASLKLCNWEYSWEILNFHIYTESFYAKFLAALNENLKCRFERHFNHKIGKIVRFQKSLRNFIMYSPPLYKDWQKSTKKVLIYFQAREYQKMQFFRRDFERVRGQTKTVICSTALFVLRCKSLGLFICGWFKF